MYVANSSSLESRGPGSIAVIDATMDSMTATVPVGDNPLDIALSPDGATAYVSSFSTDMLDVIDTATLTVTHSIGVGNGPFGLALASGGRYAYVADRQPFGTVARGNVAVVDTVTDTVLTKITVGENPTSVAVADTSPPTCAGDCNGDGRVAIDELLLAVNIALGSAPIDQCPLLDSNGDDTATVNEILAAVDDTLAGCPAR